MKPIEEGCLAIVVDGQNPTASYTNIGKIVRIGKFIGDVPGLFAFNMLDLWEVDKPMLAICRGKQRLVYLQRERNLQRLDLGCEEEQDNKVIIEEMADV